MQRANCNIDRLSIQSKCCRSLLRDGEKRDVGTSTSTNKHQSSSIFFPQNGENTTPRSVGAAGHHILLFPLMLQQPSTLPGTCSTLHSSLKTSGAPVPLANAQHRRAGINQGCAGRTGGHPGDAAAAGRRGSIPSSEKAAEPTLPRSLTFSI